MPCPPPPPRAPHHTPSPPSYAVGYGAVSLTPKDMPVQVAAWDNTGRIPLFDVPTAEALTGALHVCSYECFFSRWQDAGRSPRSSCLLVPPTVKESEAHSFCYGATPQLLQACYPCASSCVSGRNCRGPRRPESRRPAQRAPPPCPRRGRGRPASQTVRDST